MSNEPGTRERFLLDLADARDMTGLAALLAPCGQTLPNPDRLYRGLGLDDAAVDMLLSNLAAGRGVPALEAYSPEKLADLAVTESLAYGSELVSALFNDRTAEVEAALRRLESALVEVKSLFSAEVARRLAAEPEIETWLLGRVAKSYVLGEIPPYLQSASLGGADGAGAGCALFFAVEKGFKERKHPIVVEFDRPASGVIDIGVYPNGIRELVILGDIPGPTVRAIWMEGQRFTPQELEVTARYSNLATSSGAYGQKIGFGAPANERSLLRRPDGSLMYPGLTAVAVAG